MSRGIGKKKRFEIFKRDSFQCQYCGASAPEVILEIDHIKPVSIGGICYNRRKQCEDSI